MGRLITWGQILTRPGHKQLMSCAEVLQECTGCVMLIEIEAGYLCCCMHVNHYFSTSLAIL